MSKQAGYEEIAERIDQQAIADQLARLERDIIAKYYAVSGRTIERALVRKLRAGPIVSFMVA